MPTITANFRITSQATTGTADIDTINDRITLLNHKLSTGDAVGILPTAAGSLPTGLTSTTPYYVILVDASTISLATSYANAFAGTVVDITSVGVGVQTLYKGGIGRVLLTVVPVNAVLRDFRYDVVTTFDSVPEATGSDGGAIDDAAIGVELVTVSATQTLAQSVSIIDESNALATISNGENAWDSGNFDHDDIIAPDFATVDDAVQTGSDTWLAISIEDNNDVVRVGEVNLYIEYDFSGTTA